MEGSLKMELGASRPDEMRIGHPGFPKAEMMAL